MNLVYDDLGLDEKGISEKKVVPNFTEIEIFTDGNFQRLIRKLRQNMEREGLKLGPAPVTYGKATFIKEGFDADKPFDIQIR
jgi:hypothetical protein